MSATIIPSLGLAQTVENCSAVTQTDWPTRVNDIICSQRALYTCQQDGCEAPLCIVHVEVCPKCKGEFCEGCLSVHAEANCLMRQAWQSIEPVIDELTYRSYAHNRNLSPDTPPEKWALIYANAAAFETRYRRDKGMTHDTPGN